MKRFFSLFDKSKGDETKVLLLKLSNNLFSCHSYIEKVATNKELVGKVLNKKIPSIIDPVR